MARTRRDGSPHETTGDPSFGSPAFCADCHQFTFPVLSPEGAALRMYIGGEYPVLRLSPDVPTAASMVRRRATAGELPACDR